MQTLIVSHVVDFVSLVYNAHWLDTIMTRCLSRVGKQCCPYCHIEAYNDGILKGILSLIHIDRLCCGYEQSGQKEVITRYHRAVSERIKDRSI